MADEMSREEALAHALPRFLASAVEVAEKIQYGLQHHSERLNEFHAQQGRLFAEADVDLKRWLTECGLSVNDPWEVYRVFLLALEEEHLKLQQQIHDPLDAGKPLNPFLTLEDEAEDKGLIDEMIQQARLTRNEVLAMMAHMSPAELGEIMRLSKGVSQGRFWDKK